MSAVRRHERDRHGSHMRFATCEKFTCPESRHFEMKRHLEIVHGVRSESLQPKKRKHLKSDVVVPETRRIPSSPVIAATNCMPAMGGMDLEEDPQVDMNPEFTSLFGPTCHRSDFYAAVTSTRTSSSPLSFHLLLSYLLLPFPLLSFYMLRSHLL